MLWLNNTTNGKGEEYCLSTTQKVALTWKQMSIGAYHIRWSVNTPPVILIQFATEMMKYGLTKHSKKENLTKDDIPTIFKHTPCKQFFPHQQDVIKEYKVQENSNHCTMGKAKQNKMYWNLWPASARANLSSIILHQIESLQSYSQ